MRRYSLKIQKKVEIVLINLGADYESNWGSGKLATYRIEDKVEE